jgi:hypothetical protein
VDEPDLSQTLFHCLASPVKQKLATMESAMQVDVVHLPTDLTNEHLEGRVVVVFDVPGATQIRVFDSINAARKMADAFRAERLLCGEVQCQRPKGFDLGNSPREFSA